MKTHNFCMFMLTAFFCGALFCVHANAKVCFVGDEDCGAGGSFDEDYSDPNGDGKICTAEGYISITECEADPSRYIAGYCPYNSSYVMCCGKDYIYSKCVYPLVTADKCGNKYKCVCDEEKYPYTQKNATTCINAKTNTEYVNSRASGASCVYNTYNGSQSVMNAFFTKCECDRGLYPKTEEECTKDGNSVSDKACTDSDGNKYYSSCLCGEEYDEIASDCAYGIDVSAPMCQEGDVLRVKDCCDCPSSVYPFTDFNDVNPENPDSPVASYIDCRSDKKCSRGGSRYKALSCKKGYTVSNGRCVPKPCAELVTEYLADNGGDIFTILTNNTELTHSSKDTVVVLNDVNVKSSCVTSFKKIYSAGAYARTLSGDDILSRLMKTQCTSVPTITLTSGNKMWDTELYSLKIKGSLNVGDISGDFICTNCSIETDLIAKGEVKLKYDPNMPNADNAYVYNTNTTISYTLDAQGYDFNVTNFVIDKGPWADVKRIFRGVGNGTRNMINIQNFEMNQARVMMKDIDANVQYTYMGIPYNKDTRSWSKYVIYQGCGNDDNYYRTSFFSTDNGRRTSLNLYNSTYTVGQRLFMSSGTRIGQGLNDGTGLPESGLIKFGSFRSFTNLFYPLPSDTDGGLRDQAITPEGELRYYDFASLLLEFRENNGSDTGRIDSYCYMDSGGIPHDGAGKWVRGGHGRQSGCRSDNCNYFHDCGKGACRITDDDRDCKAKLNCYVFRSLINGRLHGIGADAYHP